MICSIFCGSGFFAAATFGVVLCETDGATLADAVVAGVVLAVAVAGVVLAVVVAGVLLAVAAAGVAVVLDVAGVAVVLAVAGDALGDVFALAAGDFMSLLRDDFGIFSAGVALVAGVSVEVLVSGAVAGVFFIGFSAFSRFSGLVGAGDSVAVDSFKAGPFSFMAGA